MAYSINILNVCRELSHTTNFELKKTQSDTNQFIGSGFFHSPFSKDENDFNRSGLSTAKVTFQLKHSNDLQWIDETTKREWDIEIYCNQPYGCKFPQLSIFVICDEGIYTQLEFLSTKQSKITISFEVLSWKNYEEDSDENSFNVAKAKIINFNTTSNSSVPLSVLVDYEVKDIENYLIRTNCFNSASGQVAEICKEFADSFRQVPSTVNKNDLLDEINSLIASYRYTFHIHLKDADAEKIKSFTERYGFEFNAYSQTYFEEFEKITDKKDKYEAIRIANNLWSWKKAEEVFRNGYVIGEDEAGFIADEYIKLKYVYSKTCERILFDVLISSRISEYSLTAQYQQCISSNALLSIPIGFYKPDEVLFKNKNQLAVIFEAIFNSTFHLVGRVISGLISWFVSGLIAGNNETAHIVLFGTMFAADTVLLGLYKNHQLKNDKQVASSKEEHYFNIIKNMCNLHSCSLLMDVKLIRHMLNEFATSGVIFQHQVFQLLSAIEARK